MGQKYVKFGFFRNEEKLLIGIVNIGYFLTKLLFYRLKKQIMYMI